MRSYETALLLSTDFCSFFDVTAVLEGVPQCDRRRPPGGRGQARGREHKRRYIHISVN